MIVDDEKDVHTYLKQIIDWDELDLSLICEAEDSISASELFALHRPQIVFLDVCIPNFEGETGLDLAREFRCIDRDTRVIIITGYANFDYAQQALSLGATDLLLKPLRPEDVHTSLKKAIHFYQDKRQQLLSQAAAQTLIQDNLELLRERSLSFLLDHAGEIDHNQIVNQLQLLSWNILNRRYTVVHMVLDGPTHSDDMVNSFSFPLLIRQMCVQTLEEHDFKVCANFPEDTVIRFLISWSADGGNERLEVLLNQLAQSIFSLFRLSIKVGIGPTTTDLREITHSAKCALQCLSNYNADGSEVVFNYKNYQQTFSLPDASYSSGAVLTQIEQDLMFLRYKNVIHHLNTWFQQNRSLEDCRCFCNSYLLLLSKLSHAYGIHLWTSGGFASLLHHISSAPKKQMKHSLLCVTEDIFTRINDKNHSKQLQKSDKILAAIAYIQEHLPDPDLGLDQISSHLGITKNYLGRLFLKEEGVSIGAFINQARIDLAKKLLEQTNLKIVQIAAEIGFYNTKYFGVVFKSVTGMTPLDYRRTKQMESAK